MELELADESFFCSLGIRNVQTNHLANLVGGKMEKLFRHYTDDADALQMAKNIETLYTRFGEVRNE